MARLTHGREVLTSRHSGLGCESACLYSGLFISFWLLVGGLSEIRDYDLTRLSAFASAFPNPDVLTTVVNNTISVASFSLCLWCHIYVQR